MISRTTGSEKYFKKIVECGLNLSGECGRVRIMNTESENMESVLDILQNEMRNDMNVSAKEFEDFLEYRWNVSCRDRLYKNFTDSDGNITIYTQGSRADKQTLNELSMKIARYEQQFTNSPIYDELKQKYNIELPEFLKDVPRDSNGKFIETVVGWYQNSKGDLFHYDGTIWDEVPDEKISSLEFLG